MQFISSDQARLWVFVIACACLWSLESVIPLRKFQSRRWSRTWPNLGLTAVLVLTNLALSFALAQVASLVQQQRFGLFQLLPSATLLKLLLGVVGLDLFGYLAHVLLHKSPFGWRFHRVHHSEPEVDVTTAFRQHPGETIWRVLWQLLAIVVFGLPLWVVFIYLMISALNAQLEHANIRVNHSLDRLLKLLFVTPDMHKIHHSRVQLETDTNYANIFSFWDRLFGTYTANLPLTRFSYGLEGFEGAEKQNLRALLLLPFIN